MGIFFAIMNSQIIQNTTGLIVVVSALIFAGVLLFTDAVDYMFGWKRTAMVAVLILYALYRFSRVYQAFKRSKTQNNEEN